MHSGNSSSLNLRIHTFIVSFAFSSMFVALLCLIFNPRWETNDDVAMSMVAHGYGLASYGSPNLLFSNVLWGYLVRGLPTIHGILGYSLASLGVAVLAGTSVLYFFARLGVGYLAGLLVLALVLLRPVLFPQFTVNAGLLTCGGVLGWLAYARNNSTFCLALSCVLAFFGYLVRPLEFVLVLGVAIPFFPWEPLRTHGKFRVAFALLVSAIAAAWLFDYWSSSGPAWNYFWELNWARAPFTDFDAEARLLARPDVMARHGLSENDVELISHWFFVDRRIANPAQLRAIVTELGPSTMTTRFSSGLSAIASLAKPELLPLLVSGVALLALAFSRRLFVSWSLFLGILFAMGFVGRPGILRVYFPVLVLLILLPIALKSYTVGLKGKTAVVLLAIACFANARTLIREAEDSDRMITAAQDNHFHAHDSIVIWGSSFPFESRFPVFAPNSDVRDVKMFSLGVFTFAPFAVARAEEERGRSLIARLRSADGVLIVAEEQWLKLLGTYCAEHFGTQISERVAYESKLWTVHNVKCNVGGSSLSN